MKGNEDEYNKGFFAAIIAYGNTHFYLFYIYYGEGKE
jgi:beta-xylosidase